MTTSSTLSNHQLSSSRKQCDFTKLLMAGYDLELNEDNTQDFHVVFHGPKNTIYEGGVWRVHVTLPDDYPFASPSIGFMNKLLHPNVDEASGSVCLDVINQTWTPLYSLVNVFEVFLPQLLTYPNPADPLNSEAASLLMRDKCEYDKKVREYVRLYASKESWEKEQREKKEAQQRRHLDHQRNGLNGSSSSSSSSAFSGLQGNGASKGVAEGEGERKEAQHKGSTSNGRAHHSHLSSSSTDGVRTASGTGTQDEDALSQLSELSGMSVEELEDADISSL